MMDLFKKLIKIKYMKIKTQIIGKIEDKSKGPKR